MRKRKIIVTESELIDSIRRIVNEQAAMLGFGNMGGLSMGISKPSDKYELDEDAQDTNTSNTYNINYMDQEAANQNMEDWEMGEDYELEESVANLVRNELLEAQAKEAKKWIRGAVKKPGALRRKLGVKKGDKINMNKINQEMRKLKSKDSNKKKPGVKGLTKSDLRTYKQLNLAKTLRGMSKKKHAKESRRWVKK